MTSRDGWMCKAGRMSTGGRSLGRAALLGAIVVVLAACGVLQPTPARFRPPLPDAEPMPDLRVEDLVAFLEQEGLECSLVSGHELTVGGDNEPSGWNCRSGDQEAGDWLDVTVSSGEEGPIEGVGAHLFRDDGSDAAALDAHAAAMFDALVVAPVVPEAHRPTADELLVGVQRNFPMELGGGWFLGFDRSSITRTIRVVYSSAGG